MYNQISANKKRTWVLIIIFILFISALGYLIGFVTDYGNGIFVFAIAFSLLTALLGYYSGDKIALATSGAKEISKEQNPYVYRMVENLCIANGMPMPKVYIIDSPAINAFATGRDPKHSSIALTTGSISRLENEELEGVIAHELSHVKNYDIRLMMIVIVLVGTVSLLANWFFRVSFFGSRRSNDRGGGLSSILTIAGIILIILSPLIAQLIKLAVSRKREYLADASGALLTRYPEGLAKALEKINADSQIMSNPNAATAHLYISNPFKNKGKFFSKMFSTHPPIEDRIDKLRKMANNS